MPRALQGDEWSMLVWGREPQDFKAFSLEEAPTLGRGSSLHIYVRENCDILF
jgi:hypothetical protein